jgi:HlyD family secretion protein
MKHRVRFIVPPLLVVAAIVVWWVLAGGDEAAGRVEASGTVEATDADLGFQTPGRIEEILVREGDRVQAGLILARLEREELAARVRSAEAQLQAVRAGLAEMERGSRPGELAQAQAAVRAAEERRDDSARDLRRVERLFEGGAVSQEALDKSRTALRVAEAALDQAREAYELVQEGPRAEQVQAQRARVRQAEAQLAQAEAAAENAVITAPFDGLVTLRHREPGESVSPGVPVLTLRDLEDRWVRIYVREDRIGAVRIGQSARITSDTYPDRTYDGEVMYIGDEAEFTPRNVQTAEERIKLVYPVKVRITGDPDQDLKPGIPADVRLAEVAG